MKTNKIILIAAAAALLAASCGKEDNAVADNGCIKLFAEHMDGSNSKIYMDPDSVNGATWVADEHIDLNGTRCTIKGNSTDGFYLDGITPLTLAMYAVYPAAINNDGNHIAVSNSGAAACGIMAAKAAANSRGLEFRHLTGGIRLTLKNTKTDADLNVARLVVTATTATGDPAIYKDLRPTMDGWSPSLLPAIPTGEVGEISGELSVLFISDMTLFLKDGSHNYKTISAEGGEITFCMPLLAREVKNLTITGYSSTGDELFTKTKTLETATAIERNRMYNIPTIEIQ